MKNYFSRICLFGMLSFLLLTSCSEDSLVSENFESSSSSIDADNGRDRGRNNQSRDDLGSNEVTHQWTDLMLEIERYATGFRPCASARAFAYINLAAYETAVPRMPRLVSNSGRIPEFTFTEIPVQEDYHLGIALNTCYARVMDHFILNVPADLKAGINDLEERLLDGYSRRGRNGEAPDPSIIENSIAWGEDVASAIIAYSQTDTDAEEQILDPQPRSYVPPTGVGYWTFSAEPERALFPYWEDVRTFVISSSETSTIEPKPYNGTPGSPYYNEFVEVYEANNSAREEKGEQLWIAEFWSDDTEGIMFSPPARQYAIANQLIDQYNLSLESTLRLYLKLGFAMNDAAVSTWHDKYHYMVQRPTTFIHEFMDPNYQTNLYSEIQPWPNPSFPGYPSGHSSFASAAGGVFIDFFGNRTDFVDRCHAGRTEFNGTPRRFTSFEQMAHENAFSRVPLGVHIPMDCAEGLRLGYEISSAVNNYNLRERRS